MLGRVTWRLQRGHAQAPDVDGLAVADRLEGGAKLGCGADDVRGAGQRGQLAGTRDVVVVEVGLQHVADAQAPPRDLVEVDVDVTPGIDDRRLAAGLVDEQRAQVAQARQVELADLHRVSLRRATTS